MEGRDPLGWGERKRNITTMRAGGGVWREGIRRDGFTSPMGTRSVPAAEAGGGAENAGFSVSLNLR